MLFGGAWVHAEGHPAASVDALCEPSGGGSDRIAFERWRLAGAGGDGFGFEKIQAIRRPDSTQALALALQTLQHALGIE